MPLLHLTIDNTCLTVLLEMILIIFFDFDGNRGRYFYVA